MGKRTLTVRAVHETPDAIGPFATYFPAKASTEVWYPRIQTMVHL